MERALGGAGAFLAAAAGLWALLAKQELEDKNSQNSQLEAKNGQLVDKVTQLTKEVAQLKQDLVKTQADIVQQVDKLVGKPEERFRGVDALDFYDAVLTFQRFSDVYDTPAGWPVRCREGFSLTAQCCGVRVIPLGHFKAGKTWLICRLSGEDLPRGSDVPTEGLSIKEAKTNDFQIVLLDTVGSNSPIDAIAEGHEEGSHQAVTSMLQELKVQEDFLRQLAFRVGQVILLVVGQISHKDQTDLVLLAQTIRKEKARKEIVVVHNLKDWSREQLLAKSSKDGLSYPERNQRLFGLSDVGLTVTLGDHSQHVTRHLGLFDGGQSSPIKVMHYYLTNDHLPCSINDFIIQDLRNIITQAGTGNALLGEELANAATRIQRHFARFTTDEPKIVFDSKRSCFETEVVMPDGSVTVKPRSLGSYFSVGSDDTPYNIVSMPCQVKTTTGRAADKRKVLQDRAAYLLQLELPGLTSEDAEELKKAVKEGKALRKEPYELGGPDMVVVNFKTRLLSVPEHCQETVESNTEGEVRLSTDPSTWQVSDEGSRADFVNGQRTLRAILPTGITDWDTSEEPVVTYLDGVLSIALVREQRSVAGRSAEPAAEPQGAA